MFLWCTVSSIIQLHVYVSDIFAYHSIIFIFTVQKGIICDDEEFTAECPGQSSIIIQEAQYGHIAISRCIEFNTGYFGCKASILDLLSERCSGKQSCLINGQDPSIKQLNPCRKGLMVYMDITYRCISGETLNEYRVLWNYYQSLT